MLSLSRFTTASISATAAHLLLLSASVSGAIVEGDCLPYPVTSFLTRDCISPTAKISCRGTPGQIDNFNGYWTRQSAKNAGVVVQPANAQDVSTLVGLVNQYAPDLDWSFAGGSHSSINASSAIDLVIDLSSMNKVTVLPKYKIYDGSTKEVVSYEGGATAGQVLDALANTGRTILSPRMRGVGMGGFTTGGGIGFLTFAKGYASESIVAMEVVLPSGQLVTATPKNSYSDLFFAINGGNGQFGTVTKFFVMSYPTPSRNQLASVRFEAEDMATAHANIAAWYKNNKDPYSLVYFANI